MNTDQPAGPSQAPTSKRAKRKKRKAVLITRKDREGFAHFILQTADFSKHSGEVSLGVIRKELAAEGIDVKKNKAHIKAGLGKLVSTNVLLRVPGSYKLIAEAKLPPQPVKKDKSAKKQGAEKIKRKKKSSEEKSQEESRGSCGSGRGNWRNCRFCILCAVGSISRGEVLKGIILPVHSAEKINKPKGTFKSRPKNFP